MTTSTLLYSYLALLLLQSGFSLALDIMNRRFVTQNAHTVPHVFTSTFDQETYAKSTAYTLDKNLLGIVSALWGTLVFILVLVFGVFGILDNAIGEFGFHRYLHGIFFIFGISLFFSITELPLKVYSTFVLEERYGFNKLTVRQWIIDAIKGALLSVVLLSPLLLGLFWFMDSTGDYWWIYAFIFVSVFQITLSFLYPVFIAPLFNKFTPLQDGELKEKIFAMADKIKFSSSEIVVMDGSKRSTHANAYFAGFGKAKRIVLFDTLISLLSAEQTVAVLAHEMGHAKLHHIKKMLVLSLVLSFGGFWVLGLLLQYAPLFQAFGFSGPSFHGALVVLTFGAGPITFFLSPVFSMLSRAFEYQADDFATAAVGSPRPLSDALLALSKKSLANLTPHPWYSFFHYSHPTLFERLQSMNRQEIPSL